MKPIVDLAGAGMLAAGPMMQLSGIYDLGQVAIPGGAPGDTLAAAATEGLPVNGPFVFITAFLVALKLLAPTIQERATRKTKAQDAALAEAAAAAAHQRQLELMQAQGPATIEPERAP